MDSMFAKYTEGLPLVPKDNRKRPREDSGAVVLLTGSTGNLGSDILKLLCNDSSNVAKIYTFNRRSSKQSIYERHAAQLQSKSIDVEFLNSPKLIFLEGDSTLPNFDLDLDVYEVVGIFSYILIVFLITVYSVASGFCYCDYPQCMAYQPISKFDVL